MTLLLLIKVSSANFLWFRDDTSLSSAHLAVHEDGILTIKKGFKLNSGRLIHKYM